MTRLRPSWKVGVRLSGYYDDETDRTSVAITGWRSFVRRFITLDQLD